MTYKNHTITKCQVGAGYNVTDQGGKIIALHCPTIAEAKMRISFEIEE